MKNTFDPERDQQLRWDNVASWKTTNTHEWEGRSIQAEVPAVHSVQATEAEEAPHGPSHVRILLPDSAQCTVHGLNKEQNA